MNSRHDQSSEQQMEPNQETIIAEESSSFSILSPSSSTSKNEKNMHYAPFLYATAMKSMIEVNICSAITIYFLRRFVRIDILAMRETFEISTYYPLLWSFFVVVWWWVTTMFIEMMMLCTLNYCWFYLLFIVFMNNIVFSYRTSVECFISWRMICHQEVKKYMYNIFIVLMMLIIIVIYFCDGLHFIIIYVIIND